MSDVVLKSKSLMAGGKTWVILEEREKVYSIRVWNGKEEEENKM